MSKLTTEYGILASAMDPKLSTEYAVSAPAVAPWSNDYYITGAVSSSTSTNLRGLYYKNEPTDNKGWFPTQDGQNNLFYTQHASTISFWYKGVTNSNYITPWYQMYAADNSSIMGGIEIWFGNSSIYILTTGHINSTTDRSFASWSLNSMTNWTHICVVIPSATTSTLAVTGATVYINGTSLGSPGTALATSANITQTNIVAFGLGAISPQYITNNNTWLTYGGADTIYIDEVSTWRKGFSQSEVWEIVGLNTSDGSGTPAPTDSESHSASTGGTNYLERYVRCGDLPGDGTALKDALDSNFELIGNGGNDFTAPY